MDNLNTIAETIAVQPIGAFPHAVAREIAFATGSATCVAKKPEKPRQRTSVDLILMRIDVALDQSARAHRRAAACQGAIGNGALGKAVAGLHWRLIAFRWTRRALDLAATIPDFA